MRRLVITALLLFSPAAAAAQSLERPPVLMPSVRDIIELSRAGLGDEVLLALIDVNRTIYPVDPDTLKALKQAGVSQAVILAMVKSGREVPPPPVADIAPEPVPAPISAPVVTQPPQVVIVEREARDEPRVREVAVPVPVYVHVPAPRRHVAPRPERRPQEPVYWGFGGKLRPDAWKTAADVQKDARVPKEPQKK